MGSLLDRLFNKKPKDLPEQIEGYYEEAVKKASKESYGPMQTLIIMKQLVITTETLKEIYSDVHRQLGYSRQQYEKLVDEKCKKVMSKYFPTNPNDDYLDDNPADWAV